MIKDNSILFFRIDKNELLLFVLFIPFFKLLSFNMFQEQHFHESFFKVLEQAYDVGRIIAASFGYLFLIIRKGKRISNYAIAIILLFVAQAIVCLINKSVDFFFLIKIYTYIGFILIINYSINRSLESVLRVTKALFGILTMAALVTIIVFPLGFLQASGVYDAVYLLGGKNASFPFYYIFLLSSCLFFNITNKQFGLPKWWYLVLALMIYSAIICNSVYALIAIILISILSALFVIIKPKFDVGSLSISLAVLLTFIYLGASIPAVVRLLELFGRNATFSYRTLLWNQAFGYIVSNPLFGAGNGITFSLGPIVTDHTHSTYLDMFAKYGIIVLLLLLWTIRCTLKYLAKIIYKPLKCYLGLFFLIYLVHMGFNDYNYNFFVIIVMLICSVSERLNKDEDLKTIS